MTDPKTREAAENEWCKYGEKIQLMGERGILDAKLLAQKQFIAGAEFKQKQILELLRSDDRFPEAFIGSGVNFAKWIEEKLK